MIRCVFQIYKFLVYIEVFKALFQPTNTKWIRQHNCSLRILVLPNKIRIHPIICTGTRYGTYCKLFHIWNIEKSRKVPVPTKTLSQK
jgi:hypothetical protein